MKDSASSAPKMLHAETISQDFEPKPDEKPWERQKNEPANWYMRFQRYKDLGPKRSLRAVVVSEPQSIKATKGNKKQATKSEGVTLSLLSVPGAWSRAAKVWNWVERAKAYDLHRMHQQAFIMRLAASHYGCSSRADRLIKLSDLADRIQVTLKAADVKYHVALIAQLRGIFDDIDKIITELGMHDEADADALLRFLKQHKS